jgi:Domain of unknown function (DUF4332)
MEDRMPRLIDVKGMAPEDVSRLGALGVATTTQLLARAASHEQREALAAESGVSEVAIGRFVALADLERVRGIAWDYATLVFAAGITSVPELAFQSDPAGLRARLAAANAQEALVKRIPTESQVAGWISSARELPELVTYAPMEVY